jgi:dephospho-CoA kinase
MRVLGLTGSIGMGKTTAARLLKRMRVPVHDADAAVHTLFAPGGAAVPAIAKAFPGAVHEGAVDRLKLGATVFGPDGQLALGKLEAIVHPLVRLATRRWLAEQARRGRRTVVLDVPLLFESHLEEHHDSIMVVSAPAFLQRQRVLRRRGMSEGKLREILARQMPDRLKRRRADAVISSGLGQRMTFLGLRRALRQLKRRGAWKPGFR